MASQTPREELLALVRREAGHVERFKTQPVPPAFYAKALRALEVLARPNTITLGERFAEALSILRGETQT